MPRVSNALLEKVCPECGDTKPRNMFPVWTRSSTPCKDCRDSAPREVLDITPPPAPSKYRRTCFVCGAVKEVRPGTLSPEQEYYCRDCKHYRVGVSK